MSFLGIFRVYLKCWWICWSLFPAKLRNFRKSTWFCSCTIWAQKIYSLLQKARHAGCIRNAERCGFLFENITRVLLPGFWEKKIVFGERNFGKETYFWFFKTYSEVHSFNTPKLARGLFLSAGYFWGFLYIFFAVFRKTHKPRKQSADCFR